MDPIICKDGTPPQPPAGSLTHSFAQEQFDQHTVSDLGAKGWPSLIDNLLQQLDQELVLSLRVHAVKLLLSLSLRVCRFKSFYV